ncbi:undecaprenyl diphosphate synthase family protein [Amycolatopsis cihanbeyliensis]|uniref:Undecaprenyl diphosphate synthase n=1 Tax=Amycolatopsis cihanbeyliensis TaxID=1128664 RepID=A0A542DI34_AMYCI|nr:undecaprenyl diphosphate synthase family protein [Amycolatopsis cihanbeyliensis]TQJ02749.1 undecaprenyl diphosphate synthase [Amycolatopsis cihanbeyliensis]
MNVLLVPDGSRRWARKHDVTECEGRMKSVKAIAMSAEAMHVRGINRLYVTIASRVNLERPGKKVRNFLEAGASIPDMCGIPIKFTVAGNLSPVPPDVRKLFAEKESEHASGFPITITVGWSLPEEIVDLVNRFRGHPRPVTTAEIAKECAVPDAIDLWIRAGGDMRFSGFFPALSPYLEIVCRDEYMPDFTPSTVDEIFDDFHRRERRFGA